MIPRWHNDFWTPWVFSRVEKLKFLVRKPLLYPAELRDHKGN
jgi:hypothetical protein